MRIQKFDSFTESLVESETDYYKGNTKLSRWLRKVDGNMEYEYDKLRADSDPVGGDGGKATINRINSILPLFGRLIASSGAAIADFFFKGDSKDSYSKMSKDELKSKKKNVLDDWEKEKIGDKNVTEKDAEDFYKSGALKGKKYFGKNYEPLHPKNDDEKQYSSYLTGAMGRYYDKINKK
ncbi:MAG: hypothetical protein EBZ95_09215 [Chitinophagia bacterium]|nr:hypothetical protein [Chitinophagia bacterium]